MRRIYESGALERDDDNPFQPNESDASTEPQAMRTIPGETLSRYLIPHWIRHRSISIDISTPERDFSPGEPIPFYITMKNEMPFPIAIETVSPLSWMWFVDGVQEASHVVENPAPSKSEFVFKRGERKEFRKHWPQSFQIATREWEPAPPGTYTIGVGINVADPHQKGLWAETDVKIDPG